METLCDTRIPVIGGDPLVRAVSSPWVAMSRDDTTLAGTSRR